MRMRISRRKFLRLTGGAAFASVAGFTTQALSAPAVIGLKPLNVRTLSFDCTNTGEQLNSVDYWVEGAYVPDALAAINDALRDYRTDEVYPISTKLLDLLFGLGRRLDMDCRFELTSGYRSPETNAELQELDSGVASNSLHMKGQAADITLPGRSLRAVYETALAMRMGGVGYYPDPEDDFIHVDIGRVRRWES
jgi:uncharacterized protein YcbK (DUF882 family)